MTAFHSVGYGNISPQEAQYYQNMRKLQAVVMPDRKVPVHDPNVKAGLMEALSAMNIYNENAQYGDALCLSPYGNNAGAFNAWNSCN